MWNISKEVKDEFLKHNLLPIHETDEEWVMTLRAAQEEGEDLTTRLKEELAEVKEQLLHVLPSRFLPYLQDGTLNQPSLPIAVRMDYLKWVNDGCKKFEKALDAAYENTKNALAFLPATVLDVFEESLHDSTIARIEREQDVLHLYVDTDGGFSSKALIHFTFKGVSSEETVVPIQVGQWFIYDELQKTDDGFAFRVLFEAPESQWTITMKEMDAEYFFRPMDYTRLRDEEKLQDTSLEEYMEGLNPEHRYWFITPDDVYRIQSFSGKIDIENGSISFNDYETVVITEKDRYVYPLNVYNPINFIYTDKYEDPYAQLSEPLPSEEIEAAILSDDLELQVRAWNTMYTNPHELADIINRVLKKLTITEENEMMVSIYVNQFYQEEILSEEVIEQYQKLISEA
jgi:hypothetical protein